MKKIITKTILFASLFGAAVALSACTCVPRHPEHPGKYEQCNKKDHKNCKHYKQNMQSPQVSETVVFYQTYDVSDVDGVVAKMYTRSSRGGESKMGTIKFVEKNDGLHMKTDLTDLRPGVTYNVVVYQCGACNDGTCCSMSPMAVDLPTLRIDQAGRLQKSYIIRGLTAAQLNNARLILTRDGGYKAAWGTLKQ